MSKELLQLLQYRADQELVKAKSVHERLSQAISALSPQAVPTQVQPSGYCADVTLYFSSAPSDVTALAQIYPPDELALVHGRPLAHKPKAYLRQQDCDEPVVPIAPFLHKLTTAQDSDLVWWSRLKSGQMAQVVVKNAPLEVFQGLVDEHRYELVTHTHLGGKTTCALRRLKDCVTALSAWQAWEQAWENFAWRQRLRGSQRQVLNAFRAVIRSQEFDFKDSGLPQPQPNLKRVALAVPDGISPVDYVKELQQKAQQRPSHWLDQIGNFWSLFNAQTAAKLWAFCVQQQLVFADVLKRHEQDNQALAAVLKGILARGDPGENQLTWRYVKHAVQRTMLYAVEVKYYRSEEGLLVELWLHDQAPPAKVLFSSQHRRLLCPQDIDVEYC